MPAPPPLHLLVTAGPTREKIDAVRDWGNIFTGKTGLDLALAFLHLGNVTLLTSNESHARQFDGYSGAAGMLGVETFHSHADLHALLHERMTNTDAPVDVAAMTAAVADYSPTAVWRIVERRTLPADADGPARETWTVERAGGGGEQGGKVKSTHDQIAVEGARTLKLVDQFRTAWGFRGVLIKFKLEVGLTDEALLQVAAASRRASAADLIVANTLAMARPITGEGSAYLIDENHTQHVERPQLAARISQWVQTLLKSATPR